MYFLFVLTLYHHTLSDTPVPQNVAIVTPFHTPSNSLFSITYTIESYAGQSAILTVLLNKS
jgi:hypothetical protein